MHILVSVIIKRLQYNQISEIYAPATRILPVTARIFFNCFSGHNRR